MSLKNESLNALFGSFGANYKLGFEMLNRIVLLVGVLLAVVPIILMSQSQEERKASSPQGIDGESRDVEVFVRDLHKYADRWEIEFEIRNGSKSSLFFATNPMRSNAELGPYIGIGEKGKILDVSVCFFDRPNYFLSRDETNVKLRKLEPSTGYIEKYVLRLPLKETIPPYKAHVADTPQPIDANKIETLKIRVGVLPDDEGVRDLLAPKVSKPYFDGYVDGGEIIEKGHSKGKMLLETQTILSVTYKVNEKQK